MPITTSYTNVVNGTLVQPANISYSAIPLTESIDLAWSTDFQNGLYSVAAVMFVTPDADTWSVTLPDATNTSVGTVFTMNNASDEFSFILKNKLGVTLSTFNLGDFQTFLLTANTSLGDPDPGGTWVPVTTSTVVPVISEITFNNDTDGNIIFSPNPFDGSTNLDVTLGADLLGLTGFGGNVGVPTRTGIGAWDMTQKYIKYDGVTTTVDAFAAFSGTQGEIGGGNPGPTLFNGNGIKIGSITIELDTIENIDATSAMIINSEADLLITAAGGVGVEISATGTGTVSINSVAGSYILINGALGLKDDTIRNNGSGKNLEIIADLDLILEGGNSEVISKSDLRLKSDALSAPGLIIEDGTGSKQVSIRAPIVDSSYELLMPAESYAGLDPTEESVITVNNITGEMSFVSGYASIKLATAVLQLPDILAMQATPYKIIDGIPGKVIVPISWNLYLRITDPAVLAFGGSVFLLYADNAAPLNDGTYGISNNIGAGVMTSADNTYSTSAMNSPQQTFTVGGAKPVNGKGVFIANDVAPFINGNSQTLTVKVLYTVIDVPI
jgi:hypothetical protein